MKIFELLLNKEDKKIIDDFYETHSSHEYLTFEDTETYLKIAWRTEMWRYVVLLIVSEG